MPGKSEADEHGKKAKTNNGYKLDLQRLGSRSILCLWQHIQLFNSTITHPYMEVDSVHVYDCVFIAPARFCHSPASGSILSVICEIFSADA